MRADHHGDRRRARHDLLALCLRDASGNRDHRRFCLRLALGQPANVGIDLFRRLFADVAGVEDDQISILALGRFADALLGQHFGHALAIIDVHLAAEAFDAIGLGRIGGFHCGGALSGVGARVQSRLTFTRSP